MAPTASLDSQPQPGLLNNSPFNNLNGGNFYNTVGDAHIYNSACSSANHLARLHTFVAASALHDSHERFPQPKCHPSTRERILQNIIDWAEKDSAEKILWLSGSAGIGKSAIAQTVAERCAQNGCLAAAFFFYRSSPERNTSPPLVATLAYQITLSVPGAKEFIVKAIEDDPALFSKDINSQLCHLIARPFTLAAREWDSMRQFLIIIDGLDECVDEKQQSDILSAVSNTLTTHELPLHFLIASRPEYHIRTRFDWTDLRSRTVRLVLDVDETARRDIEIYLEKEFSRIHEDHHILETPWPPEDVIESLAERASGQFIYASTIIKFLDDQHFQPQKRLEVVLGTFPRGTFSPFAEIDLLYTQILDVVPVSKIEETLLCLGAIIFIGQYDNLSGGEYSNTLPYLDQLFHLNPGGVEHLLMDLHSVLKVQDASSVSIRHQSFSDFLTDEARSGKYFINKQLTLAKISGLFWATIPRWLNQFEDFESVPKTLLIEDMCLYTAVYNWRRLLPEGGHASSGVLGELSAVADLAEKKAFDIRSVLGALLDYKWAWHDLYPVIIFWLSKEKLDKQNPVLWNKYISLNDKAVLRFLKQVEFLDPFHSIHFLLLKDLEYNTLKDEIMCLGIHSRFEVFDNFFSDPSRSGSYYLSPQDRADIVVWMVQYYLPRPREVLLRRFQCRDVGRANVRESFAQLLAPVVTQNDEIIMIPIVVHLSRASHRAEILIDLIRLHNPDTFPVIGCEVNQAMARYLLDNSQMYEKYQAINLEENKRIQSSLCHKWGTVPLLPVVCCFLMLVFHFKFQWIFFPSPPSRP